MSQRLEIQLEAKQEEMDMLKLKISRILASSRMAEANMASQESLISTLQSRQETEKVRTAGSAKVHNKRAGKIRNLSQTSQH